MDSDAGRATDGDYAGWGGTAGLVGVRGHDRKNWMRSWERDVISNHTGLGSRVDDPGDASGDLFGSPHHPFPFLIRPSIYLAYGKW